MASINGVTIKNIKSFRGHEGEPCKQGTLYIDGKSFGYWSQDAWGGPDCIENREAYKILKERAESYQKGCDKSDSYYDVLENPEVFLGKVLYLIDKEKTYKKFAKQGYPVTVIVDYDYGYSAIAIKSEKALEGASVKTWLEKAHKQNPMSTDTIYKSLDDFDITIDKDHPMAMAKAPKSVRVHYPDKVKTYVISEKCDMPNGLIDRKTLESNLEFWQYRGFKVEFNV